MRRALSELLSKQVPAPRYAPPLGLVLSELVLFVAITALNVARRRS